RKRKKGQRAESENCRDGEGRIFVVRFNRAFGGDDGAHAADRRAHGKKRREFGLELEQAAEKRHERERTDNFNSHENETDSAELENVSEKKARAEQDDPGLQPEFVGGDTRAE